MPIVFIFILSLLSVSRVVDRKIIYYSFVLCFTSIFCWMNSNKDIIGDWIWYVKHYDFMRSMSFFDYLGSTFDAITIKWNEPVYYAIAYITSILTDSNVSALAFIVTSIIYLSTAWSIWHLDKAALDEGGACNNSNVLVACLLFSITFTLTTQLLRQELAVAFFTISYALLVRRKFLLSALWSVLAIGCHQSATFLVVVFLAPLAFVVAFERYTIRRRLALFALPFAAALFGNFIANSGIGGDQNDGSVSASIMLLDVLLAVSSTLIILTNKELPSYFRSLPIAYVCFLFALATLISNPLAILRLYFYADFGRGISILLISTFISRNFPSFAYNIYSLILLAAAIFYTALRIELTPFDFGGLFHVYLLAPFY